jgi:cephalosporin hydroxylase
MPPVDQFHDLYYGSRVWEKTFWLGVAAQKCPLDLWIYQEILTELRPKFIIETGTAAGGSALFLASVCDALGDGRVITVDVDARARRPVHERIEYIHGSSIAPETVAVISDRVKEASPVMAILDSDHRAEHVLEELRIYGALVSEGSYLIAEDTNVNGHPVLPEHGAGPMEAVELFLKENRQFARDREREKFFMTFNPGGFLKKISAQ